MILASCTHVKAWEKGVLAKREMLVIPNPSYSELRAQVFESKEATAGGLGSSGGGCGCN